MRRTLLLGLFMAAVLSTAVPALAHHSFAATFDRDMKVSLEGVVTEVRWENPHTMIYVDVKDESGKVVNWGFESFPPGVLYRKSLTQGVLKTGTPVVMKGHRARDLTRNFAEVSLIVLSDGRTFCVPATGGNCKEFEAPGGDK